MIGLDLHDVVVFGHRPIGPEHAVVAAMNRVFLAQPVEIGPEWIGAKQFGIAGVELLEREGIGALPCRFLTDGLSGIDRPVHRAAPLSSASSVSSRKRGVGANSIPLRAPEQG